MAWTAQAVSCHWEVLRPPMNSMPGPAKGREAADVSQLKASCQGSGPPRRSFGPPSPRHGPQE